jgi:hypothetical protein
MLALAAAGAPLAQAAEVTVGEHADGQSARITGRVDIAAPLEVVWNTMRGCEGARRFVTGLKSCTVTSRDPDGRFEIIAHRIERGWPVPPVTSVFKQTYVDGQRIRVERVSGDLRALEATWTLRRRGVDSTELRYEGRIGLETQVPRAILRPFIEADFRNTLQRMADGLAGRRGS